MSGGSRRHQDDFGRGDGRGREPPRDNRRQPEREYRDRDLRPGDRGDPRIIDPYGPPGRRPLPIDDRDRPMGGMDIDEPPRITPRIAQPMRGNGGMDIDDIGPRYRPDDRGAPRRDPQQVMGEQQPRRVAYEPEPRRPNTDFDEPMVDVRTSARGLNDYFLPGEGINREVIQYEICRYLGQDARVRPYVHQDGRSGYMITAYRALTTPMIASLKAESSKFEQEQRLSRQNRSINQVPYPSSNTYRDSRYPDHEDEDLYSREPNYREPRESNYRENYRESRDSREQRDPREYREPVRDMRDARDARDPQFSPGYGGGDYGRVPAVGRHQQLPVSSSYVTEPAYSSAAPSYSIAPTTQPYPGYESAQPRIFNTTPDPGTGRTTQAGYPNVYPANTQASQQPPLGYYRDPKTGQYVQSSSGFPEEGSRHRTNR